MDALRTLLETQPLLTLFLTIALGYVVGEINIKGFSLGSGAVLFVGLAIGGFAPKAAPPAVLGTLGLLLFLYGVGIQYGAQFLALPVIPTVRRDDRHPGDRVSTRFFDDAGRYRIWERSSRQGFSGLRGR